MTNANNLEGYTDGLSGIGMRDMSNDTPVNALEYERGFLLGSKDRWDMLQADTPTKLDRHPDFMPDAESRN